ncbi:MAG TPA: biotin/lipoyl-containing protein [Burkholderiaceae bacterium]|nr:biotin/lipoyl-containing protein [Burkholderiaceae bacterium]
MDSPQSNDNVPLRSEVTGNVTKIAACPGAAVAADDAVVIVESMKMEIPVSAVADGVVVDVLVAEGEAVEEGQVLALLRPAP